MKTLLKIFLKLHSNAHDDLVVKLGENWFDNTFDSYYLEIDDIVDSLFVDVRQKTKFVLVQLLKYWQKSVIELTNNEECYLPIDFSDQYTGCFKITKLGEELKIVYGHSHREGWSVSPSNPMDYSTTITDFNEDHSLPAIKVKKQEFIDSIEENILKLDIDIETNNVS